MATDTTGSKRREQINDVVRLRDKLIAKGNKHFSNSGFTTSERMLGNLHGFVSTGLPPLDVILSGSVGSGFALGRSTGIIGEPDVGKTTLGCYLLKNIQARGGIGVIIDTEKTLRESRLIELGVDTRRLVVVEDNVLEDVCDRILFMLEDKDFRNTESVIFWDTIAATRVRRDKGRKIGEGARIGVHAQILSEAFRKINEPLASSKCALVMCNQRKQGDIGGLFTTVRKRDAAIGGDAVKFNPTQILRLGFVNTKKVELAKATHQKFSVSGEMLKNKISPTRLAIRLVVNLTGQVSEFDRADSILETMIRWGEWSVSGKVLFKHNGRKITRQGFLDLYEEDGEFRKEIGYLLEDTHRKLNSKD